MLRTMMVCILRIGLVRQLSGSYTLKKMLTITGCVFSDHKISLGKFICLWNYLSRLIIFKEV